MTGATRATAEGTKQYAEKFAGTNSPDHYRLASNLWLSSIGLGTYLGHWDDHTDQMYEAAVRRAIELGCNVIDSAINYRFQRSERAIGSAIKKLLATGKYSRDEFVIATKGGFLSFDKELPRDQSGWIRKNIVEPGYARPEEMVDSHCMAPSYLNFQLDCSLKNLGLETIDIYYVHNPETQLDAVDRPEFLRRLRAVFEFLEAAVEDGRIGCYGTATWNGYRVMSDQRGYLSLEEVFNIARQVAGERHHFSAIQLPYNLGMPEALTLVNQQVDGDQLSPLEAATRLGLTVMCSASILQAKLTQNLPSFVRTGLKRLSTDGQRAIQFVRSTPGVTTALVGMSQRSHVEENMMVARISPAPIEEFLELFGDHETE